MATLKTGHSSSYGDCWVAEEGGYYFVYLMNGSSKHGPYSNLSDAMAEFDRYVG